jgi:hypothetical protein
MKIMVDWCEEQQAFLVYVEGVHLAIRPNRETGSLSYGIAITDITWISSTHLEIEYSESNWGIILEMWDSSESNEALAATKAAASALVEFYPEGLQSLYRDGIYHDHPIAMDMEGTCFLTGSRV